MLSQPRIPAKEQIFIRQHSRTCVVLDSQQVMQASLRKITSYPWRYIVKPGRQG